MTMVDPSPYRPPVVIQFKKSSTKGGDEGYEISVTSDASESQVRTAMNHAALARRLCKAELDDSQDAELTHQLEASLSVKKVVTADVPPAK